MSSQDEAMQGTGKPNARAGNRDVLKGVICHGCNYLGWMVTRVRVGAISIGNRGKFGFLWSAMGQFF